MRNKVVILTLVVAIAIVASSCHEMSTETYSVGADGTVLNAKGEPTVDLYFTRGDVIRWCNETEFIVVIKTDKRILGGRDTIRLKPGDCIELRVLSDAQPADYETEVVTEDGEDEGQGGGTIKVGEGEGDDDD